MQIAKHGIQFVSIFILARLISPEEYGVVAMVGVFTRFAGMFRNLGLSSSTIQVNKLSHEQLSNLFWINTGAGFLLTVIIAILSPTVTIALSITLAIGSCSTQQRALLVRKMQFEKIAIATISSLLCSSAITIYFAYKGYSYWSLIYGQIAEVTFLTLTLNLLSGWRPGMPKRNTGIGKMLRYGADITGFNFLMFFTRNLDNILIGKTWGANSLGIYSKAYSLLMLPISNLRNPINSVAFPAMSKLKNQPKLFRSYYKKIATTLAHISMPFVTFMFVAATPIIQIGLGEKWLDTIPVFKILAIAAFIQPVSSLRGMIAMSSGNSKRVLKSGTISAITITSAFIIGNRWGVEGVASAYCVAVWSLALPMHVFCTRGTAIKAKDLVSACTYPAVTSLASGAITLVIDSFSSSELEPIARLATNLGIFSISTILLYLINPGSRNLLALYTTDRFLKRG